MQRRWAVLSALVMAAVLLPSVGARATSAPPAPCPSATVMPGGSWALTGGDLANTRSQRAETGIGPTDATGLAPAWATHVSDGGSEGNINVTPTVADGCVFVGTASGDVVALRASDGGQVWKTHYAVVTPGLGGAIVGSAVVDHGLVYVLIDETADGHGLGPYAVALDEQTGRQVWRSAPFETYAGSYTNASPSVIPFTNRGGHFEGAGVFAGWSPAEGDSLGQGGFVLLDAASGATLKKTFTIPVADQPKGYAGGGIWSVPAFDAASGFAFVGTSNPYSKTLEHERTNAVVKIDLRDRSSAAFGTIVASYKGVVDQYSSDLHQLNSTPACAASDALGTPYPLDDPACGQLDLDFGSPPNVFTVGGRTVVGALQKAGIYHLIDAATMKGLWATKVGAPCQACNAAATAVADGAVAGVSAPGGNAFSLDAATGSVRWLTPLASGAHYQGTTLAGGVFYTSDNTGLLDVLNAADGTILTRRPMTADVGQPVAALTSAGIAVADHTVFVAASSGNPLTGQAGWIIAYRAPSP